MFDPERDVYEIKGNSYPENTAETYEPIVKWIDNELPLITNEVIFNIKIDYQNTASSKMMSTIFSHIERIFHEKENIKIKWYHDLDDEDIISEIQNYSSYDKLDIEFIAYDRKGKRYF